MVLLLRKEILDIIQQLLFSLYINSIIRVPGVSASSQEQHSMRAYSSILSTGHLHFLCSVLLLCWTVSLQRQNLKSHNTNHDYFSSETTTQRNNYDFEGKQGLSFLSKRQKWFSWSFSLFVFLICICTRKLDSLFKRAIPSSKSLNLVCQENKNIQFTKFTDKLLPKHMEEPVI